MPSWQEEYLGALQARDKVERAEESVYKLYTTLADRTALLQTTTTAIPSAPSLSQSLSPNPTEPKSKTKHDDPKPSESPILGTTPADTTLSSLRHDLAEAQRSRGLMETRLQTVTEELQKLKIQAGIDNIRMRELGREKTALTTGLRDRDEELRGKAKLLEDVHDETVSLTLQLNMAEERARKFETENKELVDRWMRKMGQEADAMNDESKFS